MRDETIILQYVMDRPIYLETLERINRTQVKLLQEGMMIKKQVNFTRGPMIDPNGKAIEGTEQLVYFFGSDADFERFRSEEYSASSFIGTKK